MNEEERGEACNVNNIRATKSYVNNITDKDSNASLPSLQRTSKQPSNCSPCFQGHVRVLVKNGFASNIFFTGYLILF